MDLSSIGCFVLLLLEEGIEPLSLPCFSMYINILPPPIENTSLVIGMHSWERFWGCKQSFCNIWQIQQGANSAVYLYQMGIVLANYWVCRSWSSGKPNVFTSGCVGSKPHLHTSLWAPFSASKQVLVRDDTNRPETRWKNLLQMTKGGQLGIRRRISGC